MPAVRLPRSPLSLSFSKLYPSYFADTLEVCLRAYRRILVYSAKGSSHLKTTVNYSLAERTRRESGGHLCPPSPPNCVAARVCVSVARLSIFPARQHNSGRARGVDSPRPFVPFPLPNHNLPSFLNETTPFRCKPQNHKRRTT